MKITFGGCLVALVIIMAIGGICFDYSLNFIFGKDIHWAGDAVFGCILSEVVVPTAVVCFVLDLCGVESPLIGGKKQTPPAKAPTTQLSVERT